MRKNGKRLVVFVIVVLTLLVIAAVCNMQVVPDHYLVEEIR